MKLHFPSLCSIQVEWPQLNSRQRKLLGVLSSVGETSDKELEGGGGSRFRQLWFKWWWFPFFLYSLQIFVSSDWKDQSEFR